MTVSKKRDNSGTEVALDIVSQSFNQRPDDIRPLLLFPPRVTRASGSSRHLHIINNISFE